MRDVNAAARLYLTRTTPPVDGDGRRAHWAGFETTLCQPNPEPATQPKICAWVAGKRGRDEEKDSGKRGIDQGRECWTYGQYGAEWHIYASHPPEKRDSPRATKRSRSLDVSSWPLPLERRRRLAAAAASKPSAIRRLSDRRNGTDMVSLVGFGLALLHTNFLAGWCQATCFFPLLFLRTAESRVRTGASARHRALSISGVLTSGAPRGSHILHP